MQDIFIYISNSKNLPQYPTNYVMHKTTDQQISLLSRYLNVFAEEMGTLHGKL